MLQGVDWAAVSESIDVRAKMEKHLPESQPSLQYLNPVRWVKSLFSVSCCQADNESSESGSEKTDRSVKRLEQQDEKARRRRTKRDLKRAALWDFKEGGIKQDLAAPSLRRAGSSSK